jgi:hypothetical protein
MWRWYEEEEFVSDNMGQNVIAFVGGFSLGVMLTLCVLVATL